MSQATFQLFSFDQKPCAVAQNSRTNGGLRAGLKLVF